MAYLKIPLGFKWDWSNFIKPFIILTRNNDQRINKDMVIDIRGHISFVDWSESDTAKDELHQLPEQPREVTTLQI